MSTGGTQTTGTALAGLLKAMGVGVVFGIPGVQTMELFRGLAEHDIRHVLTRHEQGAGFAADGWARVTGRPGVLLLIGGPGVTNALTPVAQAHHDSVPLLVISATSQTDRAGRGRGRLHELPDQQALMATVTAWSSHVEDPEALPGELARAFGFFASARPRPVHLQLTADLLAAPCPPLTAAPPVGSAPSPTEDALQRAVTALGRSERPLMLLGGGSQGAAEPARRLAETLDAPVVLTLNGKGVVPADHPLSLGTWLASGAVLEEIARADVLVAAGTELSGSDLYYADRPLTLPSTMVRVDLDPVALARPVAEHPLHGRCDQVLASLERRLRPEDRGGASRCEAVRRRVALWPQPAEVEAAVEAVERALPDDVVVALDSTQLAYTGQHRWSAHRERSWLAPSGWGTLGCALPMSVGAAVAAPDRPAVAVVGDGGLFYTVEELSTLAALDAWVVVLLWNNDGYQEMRDEMLRLDMPLVGTEAVAADWSAVARGFGVESVSVGSPGELEASLGAACSTRRGPLLIEVPSAARRARAR